LRYQLHGYCQPTAAAETRYGSPNATSFLASSDARLRSTQITEMARKVTEAATISGAFKSYGVNMMPSALGIVA
jgi:hypothetical protein